MYFCIKMTTNLLLLVTCILILLTLEITGTHIQFYKNKNYSGLLFQSTSNAKCNNVLENQVFVGSIKTDTCLIIYLNPNCKSEWSWKKTPNDGKIWPTIIGSFHTCNEIEGGSHLNVDITTFPETPSQSPIVLQSYKNVCTCQNIPNRVQQRNKWSIQNHGNELIAYYEPNCSELKFKSLSIRAGHSANSRNIYNHQKRDPATHTNYKIQSFGPDPNSIYFNSSCKIVKPIPTIMDLELLETLNVTSHPADLLADDPEINAHKSEFKLSENEIHIEFYENPNYRVFLFETNSTSKCNNVPKPGDTLWMSTGISSIKTSTCLMLYSNYDCTGRSIKIEPKGNANLTNAWESTVTGPETLSLIYDQIPNYHWTTKSFHVCSANEQGSSLNVDLTEYHDSIESTSVPKLLQSHREICTCRNIPKSIQDKKRWSINNFGNSIVAYFEQDCESTLFNPLWIPAGQSSFSIGFGSFNKTDEGTQSIHKIQSFGPDKNSEYFRTNCVKLYSTIIKFEIMEPHNRANSSLNYVERNIEMTASSRTIFRNRGPGQLSQTYSASKSVREAFHLETGTSLSKMVRVSVDTSFDIDTKSGTSGSQSHSTGSHNDWGKSESHSQGKNQQVGKSETFSSSNNKGYQNSVTQSHGTNQQLGQSKTNSSGTHKGYGNSQTNSTGSHKGIVESNSHSQGTHESSGKSESYSGGIHNGYSDTESSSSDLSFGVEAKVEAHAGIGIFGGSVSAGMTAGTNIGQQQSSSKSGGSHAGVEKSSSGSSGTNEGEEETISNSRGTNEEHAKTLSNSGGTSEGHELSLTATKGTTSESGRSSTNSGGSSTGKEKSTSLLEGRTEGQEKSSTLSGGVKIGFERSSSFFQEASFREGLRRAYETSGTRSTSQSNSTTVENSRTFTATQVIIVPPCTEHVVHAYVKIVTNKRVEFRAITKISGQIGKRDMTAAEVRYFMDRRLEYIEDFDKYTVFAYSVGHLKAEYGVSSLINAEGSTMHDCVAENQLCPVCETFTNDAATCPEVPTCEQPNASDGHDHKTPDE